MKSSMQLKYLERLPFSCPEGSMPAFQSSNFRGHSLKNFSFSMPGRRNTRSVRKPMSFPRTVSGSAAFLFAGFFPVSFFLFMISPPLP